MSELDQNGNFKDIVSELRSVAMIETGLLYSRRLMLNQAADEIERLRKVLEPFVALIERSDSMDLEYLAKNAPGMDIEDYTPSTDKIVSSGEMRCPVYITRGDFRAARAALTGDI